LGEIFAMHVFAAAKLESTHPLAANNRKRS
jgi:hypothetical protein